MAMRRIAICLAVLARFAADGQTLSGRNVADGLTPPAVAPGAPPGVKEVSGLERINLFNGNLSLAIPLLSVGGRGEAGYSLMARVESAPWTVSMDTAPFCPVAGTCNGFTHSSSATNREQTPFQAPYTPGVVYGKRSGTFPVSCPSGDTRYNTLFTHVVFEQPDGTQVQLWDGNALGTGGCTGGGNSRGPTFRALGDSNITFISSSLLADSPDPLDLEKFTVSGRLLFPNGVEYTITGSVVTRITDRNGNFVELTYQPGTMLVQFVKDSLGRTISVLHDFNDPVAARIVDKISYFGAGGQPRDIRIDRVRTGGIPLRSDIPAASGFTGVTIGFTNFDRLVKKITLPDGRFYDFQYSPYGEPARMVLPSGGAIEYDHGAGLSNAGLVAGTYADGRVLDNPGTIANTTSSDPGWRPAIYRRLLKRRTYPTGLSGATFDAETTYSRRESAGSPTTLSGVTSALSITLQPYVEESTSGTGLTAATTVRHYFHETVDTPGGASSPVSTMMV